jgi:type VI protein secretion system component VasF
MGYKGQYRGTEHSQYQLEQITNNLYKHIRAFRGTISKTLSPTPIKTPKVTYKTTKPTNFSILYIFLMTACMIMIIFIGLDYLMDVISNEAYKNINQINATVYHDTVK